MGELSNFGSLTDHFSKNGFKVYAPKIPIYEFSILKTNVSNIAKSISEYLEEVVKKPAILVGNSLGGHLGLITSLKRPDLVKALCLTGSSGLYEGSLGETFPKNRMSTRLNSSH